MRFAAAAGLTALCVAAFRAFERPARGGGRPAGFPGRLAGPVAAVGVTLSLLGILGLSMAGFAGLLEGRTALLVAVRISAPTAVAMALAAWLPVEAAGRARAGATTGG